MSIKSRKLHRHQQPPQRHQKLQDRRRPRSSISAAVAFVVLITGLLAARVDSSSTSTHDYAAIKGRHRLPAATTTATTTAAFGWGASLARTAESFTGGLERAHFAGSAAVVDICAPRWTRSVMSAGKGGGGGDGASRRKPPTLPQVRELAAARLSAVECCGHVFAGKGCVCFCGLPLVA